MDEINLLPDDLLLRILSLVPTKDVIMAASCVSKRWRSLCSLVTRLEYDDSNYHNDDGADYKSFNQFVYRTLMSNKAPVLEKLHLNLGPKCHAVDVRIWIDIAISHRVRELIVKSSLESGSPVSLPSSLFTCETLENLTLRHCLVSDVPCCLPFLNSLHLCDVSYASLPKFLSGCPNLQLLRMIVEEKEHGEEDITIALPRLRNLFWWDARKKSKGGVYLIEAPRLEYLKIVDDVVYDSRRIENMPNLTEAHVDITRGVTHRFLRALASARRLYLCVKLLSEVPSMNIYFYRLVYLELNTCAPGWWELLTQMLQNSPKLASLKLTDEHELNFPSKETPDCWKRPSSAPESLKTFAWNGYKGRRGDLDMAAYIIKNVTSLNTATISPKSDDFEAKYKMVRDLVFVLTPLTSCQLLFD